MAAVALAVTRALVRKARLVIALLIEAEDARIAISICNVDRAIGPLDHRGDAPFVRRLESSFARSLDLLKNCPVCLHLDEEPILFRRPLLHNRVEDLIAVLLRMEERVYFRVLIGDGALQLAVGVVDQDAGRALCADVDIPSLVRGDGAV